MGIIYKTFNEQTKDSVIESVEYKAIADSTNVTDRSSFPPGTYESARPYEALPLRFKQAVRDVRNYYCKNGTVRNVIDLMTDFACEDLKIVHPNKKDEAFFKIWSQKVNLNEVVNEFVRHLLLDGNLVVKRTTAKLNKPVKEQWAVSSPSTKLYKEKKQVQADEIPIRYSFVNVLSLTWENDINSEATGKKKLIFQVKPTILTKLRDSENILYKNIYKNSPDIVDALKTKNGYALDMSKIYVAHMKKDSWDDWAVPYLYSVLEDLKYKDKLKLADKCALDGWMNVIRIWKLGDHKEKILPADGAIQRLIDILENNSGGGAVDIVWDSMIELEEHYPPVDKILGAEKYETVNKDILIGLGIPDVLLGGEGGNFSNSFIQLKTIVERLKYIRTQVIDWLNYEMSLICQAMDIKIVPKVRFGQMNLDDENATKKLVIELLDRNIVSVEAVLDVYGEDFLIEMERIKHQQEVFKKNGIKVKSPLDKPPPKPVARTSNGKPPARNGRPPGSNDTQKRQRRNIKPRTSATLLLKSFDIMDLIDDIAIPFYMDTINVSNARKLTSQQKETVDNIRMLLLSSCTPSEKLDKDTILAKLDYLDNGNTTIFNKIKYALKQFIIDNGTEPTLEQKKKIYSVVWATYYSENA